MFLLAGSWPLLGSRPMRWWSLVVAALFVTAAVFAPRVLAPLNRLWGTLGVLLHRIASPIVMGLLFFMTITPLGIALRALGKDPLCLRRDPDASTYWIERRPPGPPPATMTRQF